MMSTYGPIITIVPVTQCPYNLLGLWVDITPVGWHVQPALGRWSLVLGWAFKHARAGVGFHSFGNAIPKYFVFRRNYRG